MYASGFTSNLPGSGVKCRSRGWLMETDKRPKSIFDESFKYLNIPVEILRLVDLSCAEKMILARITYWTIRGRQCYESNRQLGELVGRSGSQASRIVKNLKAKGYVEADTPSPRRRYLSSNVSIDNTPTQKCVPKGTFDTHECGTTTTSKTTNNKSIKQRSQGEQGVCEPKRDQLTPLQAWYKSQQALD